MATASHATSGDMIERWPSNAAIRCQAPTEAQAHAHISPDTKLSAAPPNESAALAVVANHKAKSSAEIRRNGTTAPWRQDGLTDVAASWPTLRHGDASHADAGSDPLRASSLDALSPSGGLPSLSDKK